MKRRITQLSRMLLAGAAVAGATQVYGANPVFTGVAMTANGKITGSVQDADSPKTPLRVTFTVDGAATSSRTIYVTGAFSFQVAGAYLNSASHQISIVAENANSTSTTLSTTYSLTQTLTMPSNSLPTLASVALSATGKVTGTVTDANVAAGNKTTVTLTIDGVLANREEVTLGTAFALQVPAPYLNGASHSVVVKAEDANIPGLVSSQTLTRAITAPTNSLPTVSFDVMPNGRVYGTATDPDSPNAKLEVLLFVDGGTDPVGIVGLATPQFELALPAAIFGTHTYTIKVEDANIPLAFTTKLLDAAKTPTVEDPVHDRRIGTVDSAVDNNGLITGTVYDVDNPLAYLRVRQNLASYPIGATLPPLTTSNEGATLIESVYTIEPVRRAFRTAAEQDLYGNRVPRKFTTQIPLTGAGRDFTTGSYNVYLWGNNDNEILQNGEEVIGFPVAVKRSLIVNDIAMLQAGDLFSLKKTLAKLNSTAAGTEDQRAWDLFTQIYNHEIDRAVATTNNYAACTTSATAINGAPNKCRTNLEGKLITDLASGAVPTTTADRNALMAKFKPVALVNRLDKTRNPGAAAPVDCGEYRIIYAREDSVTARSFLIFEPKLENPYLQALKQYKDATGTTVTPNVALQKAGCLKIQQMWSSLRLVDDPMIRARTLEKFYYQGIIVDPANPKGELASATVYNINGQNITVNMPPVISRAHFMEPVAGTGSNYFNSAERTNGQIRSNEFFNTTSSTIAGALPADPWVLKEFQLTTVVSNPSATGGVTDNGVVQRKVQDNPIGKWFDTTQTSADATALRAAFLDKNFNLRCLMSSDLSDVNFNLFDRRRFDDGQSFSSGQIGDSTIGKQNDYLEHASVGDGASFVNQVATKLAEMRVGVDCSLAANQLLCQITPQQIMNRAAASSCAGCHQPRAQNIVSNEFDLTATDAIGPGQSWPHSLQNAVGAPTFVHVSSEIDSNTKVFRVSAALNDVFLPSRSKLMKRYLDSAGTLPPAPSTACDKDLNGM